ncbi:MAG TPA: hypothetical protein VIX17_11685 [Pyrinomonadaceae bacterium]|jgi:hypothetical protein
MNTTTKTDARSFTPGPWHVGGDGIEGLWVSPQDTSTNVICDVVHRQSGVPSPEDEANARLIAAAPRLYAAAMSAAVYIQSQDFGAQGKAVLSELMTALTTAAD